MKKILSKISSKVPQQRIGLGKTNSTGLHACLRRTLLACHCIGLLPLAGLLSENSNLLRVNWLSPYFIYYLFSLAGEVLINCATLYFLISQKFALSNFTNFMFYASGLTSSILTLRVALSWRRTVKNVEAIEEFLPPIRRTIVSACDVTTIVVLILALGEHMASIIFGLKVGKICNPDGDMWKTYFLYSNPWIFDYLQYNTWTAVFTEASKTIYTKSTFMWNYNDVLIIVFSLYLSEHFNILDKLLRQIKMKKDVDWYIFRLQYSNIVKIVQIINKEITYHVFLSFSGNLLWICMQFYNTLNNSHSGHFNMCVNPNVKDTLHGIEHTVYFTYSFMFLLVRAFCMSLMAARVHAASLSPLSSLYQVPTSTYNQEVKRFIDQVSNADVALHGLGFFSVTRNMILTMLGTIVTYELVLLQWKSSLSATEQDRNFQQNIFNNTK